MRRPYKRKRNLEVNSTIDSIISEKSRIFRANNGLEDLLNERAYRKALGEFNRADEIRSIFASLGLKIVDTHKGQEVWLE